MERRRCHQRSHLRVGWRKNVRMLRLPHNQNGRTGVLRAHLSVARRNFRNLHGKGHCRSLCVHRLRQLVRCKQSSNNSASVGNFRRARFWQKNGCNRGYLRRRRFGKANLLHLRTRRNQRYSQNGTTRCGDGFRSFRNLHSNGANGRQPLRSLRHRYRCAKGCSGNCSQLERLGNHPTCNLHGNGHSTKRMLRLRKNRNERNCKTFAHLSNYRCCAYLHGRRLHDSQMHTLRKQLYRQ